MNESRPVVSSETRTIRIGWWSNRPAVVGGTIRGQLEAAASALGSDVEIVASDQLSDLIGDAVNAIVMLGISSVSGTEGAEHRAIGEAGVPLVIALTPNRVIGEHVRLLGREADLVLPVGTHGRVVLATVLALLRWRDR